MTAEELEFELLAQRRFTQVLWAALAQSAGVSVGTLIEGVRTELDRAMHLSPPTSPDDVRLHDAVDRLLHETVRLAEPD